MNVSEKDEQLVALSSMSLGQKGLVVAFSFDTDEGERIQKMGLSPGEQLEIVRLTPSGDPVEIKIRGYFVSLRKQEADRIKVKLLNTP
jgi:Fe2+ transport system protein FeoA